MNKFARQHPEVLAAYYDSLNWIRYLWSALWYRPRKIYSLKSTRGSRFLEALVRRVWPTGPEIHDWTFQLWELVEADGPVGKKLDFTLQESLREVNTIGSKARDLSIGKAVIDMKTELERMREQTANVE